MTMLLTSIVCAKLRYAGSEPAHCCHRSSVPAIRRHGVPSFGTVDAN